MRRNLLIAATFACLPAASIADEPVQVLLYGPNAGVESMLNELPRARSYELLNYRVSGTTTARKLMVSFSGGLKSLEAAAILRAIKIELQWDAFSDPWRLHIHGNDRYARVTISDRLSDTTCYSPRSWLLASIDQEWVVVDGAEWRLVAPTTELKPCEYELPEIVTPLDGASNKSLERTRGR
jgi:hypothetical protein